MTRIATIALAALTLIMTGCASISEQLTRNNYLSTGRAPEGWMPKKSLCPDFKRNGWQDHPNNELCFAPAPVVERQKPKVAPERKAANAGVRR